MHAKPVGVLPVREVEFRSIIWECGRDDGRLLVYCAGEEAMLRLAIDEAALG